MKFPLMVDRTPRKIGNITIPVQSDSIPPHIGRQETGQGDTSICEAEPETS